MTAPVALVTGAARRIGASIARLLHKQGYQIIIHHNRSTEAANLLVTELNQIRATSAISLQADLNNHTEVQQLSDQALNWQGKVDLLVNNASSFYPTPVEQSSENQWEDLLNSNLKAAYFLSARLSASLKQHQGCIINLIDIHAQRGLPDYPIYSIAKAGLQMMTLSLAKELAPSVRVNGVSPGPILWPEAEAAINNNEKNAIIEKTLLKRTGCPEDIAEAVLFLAQQQFITGQILAVDGGKSLFSH
ncbi:pteridine reductase [Amphritea balenae]|uniref:Pteridine reductase n=1 Tax=Amphritea balenae TaxID=452629 RepID=A0A3P1SQ39_9GAMM|nr:pteridine reductase [Amphritea balenae]RRC99169.1 pteridine reductase [Amphritea balenae]GGK73357.1 pteridine reductase [Amphritea balenae]